MTRPDVTPPGAVVAFHDAGVGGPLRSLERELRWLAESVEVEILVPAGGERAPAFDRLGASVTPAPYAALGAPSSPVGLARELARARREEAWFRRRLRERPPRLALAVTSTLPAFLLAARRAGVPSVVWVAELWASPGRGRARQVAGRALLGFEARLADSVIACSAAVARQFADSANVTTIHPGVEQGPPGDGASLRRAAGIAADAPLIASVGNITRGRGQDVLLRALAKLLGARPGLRCAIEGATFPRPADLEFSTELDRLQRELGLGDAVVRTSGSAIADLYAAADVIVNPATTHAESFGRVPLEAGLAGTPAVCTRVGAIPELHADGATALLVPPGDSDALAGAIARVLDDPELGRRLAGGAADLARRIASPERSLAAFQDLIGTYIGS